MYHVFLERGTIAEKMSMDLGFAKTILANAALAIKINLLVI